MKGKAWELTNSDFSTQMRTRTLTNHIIMAISEDEYCASLPSIGAVKWSTIISPSATYKAENERLEFIGDALLYLCVGFDIYERYPDADPGIMTVRLYLTATFRAFLSLRLFAKFSS